MDRFRAQRAETIKFVRHADEPLKAFTSDRFLFGTVSAYHWLLHLALHNERHNQQIGEIVSQPAFLGRSGAQAGPAAHGYSLESVFGNSASFL